MSILQAFVLGVIQGVGEFLPISSSGHLVVIPYIFGWDYQGLNFDIALHFGTLLAILIYFWRDWSKIISDGVTALQKNDKRDTSQSLLWIIIFASIPAAIAGYLLENLAEHALRNPLLVAGLLAVFGIILWVVDYSSQMTKKLTNLGYWQGFFIGIGQALAIFPGVSRSGGSITAGRVLGFDRKTATKFSFILAVPAVLGAFALSLKSFDSSMLSVEFLVAIATSAIFGLLSIRFLLSYVSKHGFGWFAVYRLALAALILIIYFWR